jgi:GntR family transcriptional regulator, transcriptional repressor for pyruvate dehydrogenase complex
VADTSRRAFGSPGEGGPNASQRLKRPQKRSDYTAQQIVADIVNLELGSGDRLPGVSAMAERYGVGYASVREALRMLEASGLVYVKPGPAGGPVVSDRTGTEFSRVIRLYCQVMGVTFRHIVYARQALEPIVARDVAETGSEALRQSLVAAAAPGTDGDQGFSAHAREFHDLLASHTGENPILSLFARAVGQIYQDFVRTKGPRGERDDRGSIDAEHQQIAEAILDSDGDRAQELMQRHMADLVDYISAQYEFALDDVVEWTT